MANRSNNATCLAYTDIKTVLQNGEQGLGSQMAEYDNILRVLADPNSEVSTVRQYLEDLEQCVSCLGQGHPTLIRILLKFKWLDRGPELIAVYQAFMLNLVSAHINMLKPCLRSLIQKFIPDQSKVDPNLDAEDVKIKSKQDFDHVHALIKSLTLLVPMTSVVVISVLEELFPYLNKGSFQFEHYSENVLKVSHYMPSLRMELMELVVKNMLKLDVQSSRTEISAVIGTSHEDMEDAKDEDFQDALFKMEGSKCLYSQEDVKLEVKTDVKKCDDKKEECEEVTGAAIEERLATALPFASSLDAVMSLTLRFIKNTCLPQGKLNWAVTKKLYRELLSIFDKYIFPTHAPCHVQFIMFYVCNFREELADGFIDYLWKKVKNPSTQAVYRQTAACYIGSFLTRASFIPISTTKNMMEMMSQWLHAYLDQTSDQPQNADLSHHRSFYSVCQSLFYVFCFKHNDIIQLATGHKWAESLNFQRLITSKLNPLRVCVPIIVKSFASATRMHQLAYCDTIIERNNRYNLPVSHSWYSIAKPDQRHLESYFPFDPYLLPRSSHYLSSLYKEYSGSLAPDEEDMDDEEEDDFLPEDDEFGRPTMEEHISMSLGKSPVDFLNYSVSPGFKHA